MATGIAANAQEFKKFKVGLGAGYAMASGEGSSGGALVYVEPAYRLSDAFSLAFRFETAVITRGFSSSLSPSESVDVAAIGSYTVNAQYYFNNNNFRPFAGVGLGLFDLAAVSVDTGAGVSNTALASESKFGLYPRVGFDWGHFSMSLDYNYIPNSSAGSNEIKNSYFGIRIGGFFGGGRK